MINLSVVIIDGNLTADPELKSVTVNSEQRSVANFSVAVNHDNEDDGRVSFVPVEVWGKYAEICYQHLKKGSPVVVHGSLRQDRWKDEAGNNHSRFKIMADEVLFRGRKPDQQQDQSH